MGEQGRHATATQAERPFWIWRFLPLTAVAALGISLLGNTLLRNWHWEHHPFHAFVEGMGAFCAFMLVGIFRILRGYGRLAPHFVWVFCALVAMGVLDAFHAATHAGSLFVWLHSIATLLGGVLFAFVWLPDTVASGPFTHVFARAMLPAATLLGLASVVFPAALPTMLDENGFTPFAKAINIVGGIGFLASAWRFVGRSATEGSAANAVFSNHCLIFGIAALLFGYSALWDFNWWLWHALRLTAYAIAIYYFFDLYRTSQEELRVSEERLRKVIQNMPVILDAVDEEGNIIVWNREAERATDYSAEEMVGNPEAWGLLYPDKAYRESMFAEWKRRGDHRAWEWRVRAKDSSERLIEWSNISNAFPIPGWASWGIGVDVTEHRALVQELAEREAQLRLILSSTGEGIFGIDKHGRCMFANRACAKMLGYSDESFLLGKQMHGLIHHTLTDGSPYPVEACPTYATSRSARRTRVQGELLWRADGSAFPADYQSHPMVQNGEVVGAVVTFSDMTEQLEAREALRRERDFAESLIATAPVIILVLDSEGRIVRFNPFMAELTGYRLEEVKGKDWFNTFLPESDRTHSHTVFQDSISDLQTRCNVNPILTRTGQERLVEWHNKTLKDAAGQIIGCLSIGHDITDEKEREAQLLQAQKMEVVGQLTGGVAHDFNNLLTIILGNLDFLSTELGKKAAPEIQETLQDAFSAARDAAELTQRLLALSRRQALNPNNISLDKVVRNLKKFLRRILGEQFELHVNTSEDSLTVFADPARLENALLNLIINARDAMPRGGPLTIDIFRKNLAAAEVASSSLVPGSYAVMRVTDSGTGMSPDVLSHAVEPFFTTKKSGQGTGLGLSMVYSFAKQSGGDLWLQSKPGLGTRVSLLLPEVESVKASDVTKMDLESLQGGSETILVVEDEPRVRKLLTRRLRNLGYRVIECENAQSAKQLIESHTEVDLLFSDIVMPGEMNGYDLVHWAREKRPELKLLLTTGADSEHVVSQRRNKDEQVSLLCKPYTDKMLQETIRSLLNTIY